MRQSLHHSGRQQQWLYQSDPDICMHQKFRHQPVRQVSDWKLCERWRYLNYQILLHQFLIQVAQILAAVCQQMRLLMSEMNFVLPWHRFLIQFQNLRRFLQKGVPVNGQNRNVVSCFFDCVVLAVSRVLFVIVKQLYNAPQAWKQLLSAGSRQDLRKGREYLCSIQEMIRYLIRETEMFCPIHIHRCGHHFARNRIVPEPHCHMFR